MIFYSLYKVSLYKDSTVITYITFKNIQSVYVNTFFFHYRTKHFFFSKSNSNKFAQNETNTLLTGSAWINVSCLKDPFAFSKQRHLQSFVQNHWCTANASFFSPFFLFIHSFLFFLMKLSFRNVDSFTCYVKQYFCCSCFQNCYVLYAADKT